MTSFIRVRDKDTRHQFDLPEGHRLITNGTVEVLERFEPARSPRPPKHHVPRKSTQSATADPQDSPDQTGSGDAQDRPAGQDTPTKEKSNG